MTGRLTAILSVFVILTPSLTAQGIPSPQQYFGFEMGSDRQLANWDELSSYYDCLLYTSDAADE